MSVSKWKVCHICSYYNNVLFDHLVSSQMEETEPTVFFFKEEHSVQQYHAAYVDEVNCFRALDRFLFFLKEKKVFSAYEKQYREKSFDLNVAHSLFANGYIAYRAYLKQRTPYVIVIQNTDLNVFFRYRFYLRHIGIRILRNASKIICSSESYKKTLLRKYVPSRYREEIAAKTVMIPYGIDGIFYEDQHRNDRALMEPIRMLSVGLVCRNKNQLTLCKAVERLREEGLDIRLDIIGKVQDRRLANRIKKYSFVQMMPFMEKPALKEQYRCHDLFALTSVTETFGLVYAEALSQGLPILYSKGQGFDGQFEEGEVGFSAEARNVEEIADRIKAMLSSYPRLAKNTLRAAEKFRMESVAKAYVALYGEIVAED